MVSPNRAKGLFGDSHRSHHHEGEPKPTREKSSQLPLARDGTHPTGTGEPTVKMLIICNDPPYGTERSWNGLRLAGSLARRDGVDVRVFLLGDAVGCAISGQNVPNGHYHLDRMIEAAIRHGAQVGCCGTCLDARGLSEEMLVNGTRRSTLEELTDWTLWADRVVSF